MPRKYASNPKHDFHEQLMKFVSRSEHGLPAQRTPNATKSRECDMRDVRIIKQHRRRLGVPTYVTQVRSQLVDPS